MNTIRIVITLFVLALIVISALGWRWTAAHQSAAQSAASHVALGLSMLAGVGGLIVIWRTGERT
jgi:hypothetical protein